MREILLPFYFPKVESRITPACAGNTRTSFYLSRLRLGSPPHVREIHFSNDSVPFDTRITPACAGNTVLQVLPLSFPEDHPRMCGKYIFFPSFLFSLQGSPPHVREIHFCGFRVVQLFRITPACAGNTYCKT